jgi:hypothetical protein
MPFRPRFLPLVCVLLLCAAPAVAREVPEFSFSLPPSIVSFPFAIVDAEFSPSLNAIVAVSESPNQLHIYRPDTNQLVSVNLQVVPVCVGVSPDGNSAVVGHDAWISHVDLVNAALLQTIPVPTLVSDIVAGYDNWAYVFPGSGSFPGIFSVNLVTDEQVESQSSIYDRTIARLHPGGLSMYGADTVVSPADIEKYRITGGIAEVAYDSPYHGDYPMCGNLWISADGQRIYTACGNVFRASTASSQDMRYVGSFSKPVNIEWAAHTQTGSNIAVLPYQASDSTQDGEIQYFTPDFLLYRGRAVLPRFVVGQDAWAARGRWVFFNAAGTKQYVILQAEEAADLPNDFGIVTVDCTSASVALQPTGASFGTAFSNAQFSVTGTPGCGWSSSSNVPWVNTNSFGVGDGTVTYTVAANSGFAPRNGTITVGNAAFAVSQAGVTPASLVATATSPTSVSLTWTFAGAADHFEVWRNAGGGFTLVGSPSTTAFTDTTAANAGYVYTVRAVAAGGATSVDSAPDFTHTFILTDPVLSAGMRIRAAHVTQLRAAVNAIRAAAGVAPATFTDPSLPSVVPKRVHVTELRDAINAMRAALALPPLGFSSLPVHDRIRAATTEELRAAIR